MSALHYGSLGRRGVAFLLDALFLFIPVTIANNIVPVVGGIAVLFFYAPILETSQLRATLGKYLLGVQVVDLMGRRISLRAALIRNLLKFVSAILIFIGFFFALFTQKKQTLHDLLADTLVVYGRSELPIVETWMASMRELFNTSGSRNSLSELERLQALRDRGALNEDEFQEQKRKILSS